MPDLETTNGMSTLGLGITTMQDMASRSGLGFPSEKAQLTAPSFAAPADVVPPFLPVTPFPFSGNSPVGGSAEPLPIAAPLAYPSTRSATNARTVITINGLALKDGLELGALNHLYDGIIDNPTGTGFGSSGPPVFYKMRAFNTVTQAFEYWVAVNTVSLNPSGQAILAGSLTVIAVKRVKDLVGQGPA